MYMVIERLASSTWLIHKQVRPPAKQISLLVSTNALMNQKTTKDSSLTSRILRLVVEWFFETKMMEWISLG